MQPRLSVIVDTDPGIDDALAIALLCQSPEIDLKGIITTYGNTTIQTATANAKFLMGHFGHDHVPLFRGAKAPLCRDASFAEGPHGASGLGDFVHEGAARATAASDGNSMGPVSLLELLKASEGPVTLLVLGPCTNLALALALDESLVKKRVERVVAMAGCFFVPGNITPVSEFNVWADPEAAERVFASGLPLEIVPLDVTRKMVVDARTVQEIQTWGEAGKMFGAMLRHYVRFHREAESLNGCIINDPLAVAMLIKPEWGTKTLHAPVEVGLGEGSARGLTLAHLHKKGSEKDQRPQVTIYLDFAVQDVMQWVFQTLFGQDAPNQRATIPGHH